MSKYAIIEHDKVINIVISDCPSQLTNFTVINIDDINVNIGDTYTGVTFIVNSTPSNMPSTLQIKVEAYKRIQESGYDWMASREIGSGVPIPLNIKEYAAAVRLASDVLELNLVVDYINNIYWPTLP